MVGENQEIRIVGVDSEQIRMSPDKKEHWLVPFKLSAAPNEGWQKKFYDVQQRNTSAMKRKARIMTTVMTTEVSETDDLQKVLDTLKIEVVAANEQCEEDYQRKLAVRLELEELQKKQRDSTQQLKDASQKLQF